jgi:hypothetical protein
VRALPPACRPRPKRKHAKEQAYRKLDGLLLLPRDLEALRAIAPSGRPAQPAHKRRKTNRDQPTVPALNKAEESGERASRAQTYLPPQLPRKLPTTLITPLALPNPHIPPTLDHRLPKVEPEASLLVGRLADELVVDEDPGNVGGDAVDEGGERLDFEAGTEDDEKVG